MNDAVPKLAACLLFEFLPTKFILCGRASFFTLRETMTADLKQISLNLTISDCFALNPHCSL